VADEIQSGVGRTGKMFAMEHWGVEPDLLLTAKSMAAGMPLSAVVGRAEMMNAPQVGGLGGTYGGNRFAAAPPWQFSKSSKKKKLLEKAQVLGKKLRQRFRSNAEAGWRSSANVRGIGPMLALELVKDRVTKEPAADWPKPW